MIRMMVLVVLVQLMMVLVVLVRLMVVVVLIGMGYYLSLQVHHLLFLGKHSFVPTL